MSILLPLHYYVVYQVLVRVLLLKSIYLALKLSLWMRSVLNWVSSRSYALYLVHFPLYGAARALAFPEPLLLQAWPDIVLFMLSTGLAIGLAAEMTYRLVEMPCRQYGRQLARMPTQESAESIEQMEPAR